MDASSYTDMQFVTNCTRIKFQNNFLPKKRVNYDKQSLLTKQSKLYFHIINIHTHGYITINKYIIANASIKLFWNLIHENLCQIACQLVTARKLKLGHFSIHDSILRYGYGKCTREQGRFVTLEGIPSSFLSSFHPYPHIIGLVIDEWPGV